MIRTHTATDGTKTYHVRVGHGRPSRSFTRKKDAEEFEAQEKKNRARERAGLPVQQGPIRLGELADLYLDGQPNSKTWRKRMLAPSVTKFGDSFVRSLRGDEIGRWLHSLDYAPKTKTHILETLRAVLNAGVEWGYLERSPARRGAVRAPGQKRVTPINPFESWDEVCKVADAFGSPVVRFVCATGLRTGEWIDLRWSDIDVDEKVATIRGTKTATAERTIILSEPALAALRDLPAPLRRDQLVFHTKRGKRWDKSNLGKAWRAALVSVGLEHRQPYEMRHTFATLALEAGVPIEDVSEQLGHKSIEITLRYYRKWRRPRHDAMREALNRLEENDEGTSRDGDTTARSESDRA